jgi:hypothetical protein
MLLELLPAGPAVVAGFAEGVTVPGWALASAYTVDVDRMMEVEV